MRERANYSYDCAAQVGVPPMMLGAAGAGIITAIITLLGAGRGPGAGIIEAEDAPVQHN